MSRVERKPPERNNAAPPDLDSVIREVISAWRVQNADTAPERLTDNGWVRDTPTLDETWRAVEARGIKLAMSLYPVVGNRLRAVWEAERHENFDLSDWLEEVARLLDQLGELLMRVPDGSRASMQAHGALADFKSALHPWILRMATARGDTAALARFGSFWVGGTPTRPLPRTPGGDPK